MSDKFNMTCEQQQNVYSIVDSRVITYENTDKLFIKSVTLYLSTHLTI